MESAEVSRIRRNRRVYTMWSAVMSLALLWPLVRIIRDRAELGTMWAALALPVAAFSIGMSISMLSLPWLANSNRNRLSAIYLSLLTGLAAASMSALAVIYHRGNPVLFLAAATTTVIVLGMLSWHLKRRKEPPAKSARLWGALAVIVFLELGLGYWMIPESLRPFN